MNISDRIKSLRIEKGNTQLEIAEKLGIIVESYRKYELGSRIPAKKSLEKLANVFDVSVSYLIGETNIKHIDKINQKIDSLSENRQQKVFDYIDKQYYEQEIESNVVHLRNDLIPYQVISEQSLSAGYGNGYTDEQETYTVYWGKDVRYDYAAEIEGNSMEPKFHSGDIALIRKTHVNDYDGCVCVIDDIANQRVYIKKIHIEDTHVRLESLNKDTYDNGELIYPDILLENTENLRLIGKVIDSFKPIEIK